MRVAESEHCSGLSNICLELLKVKRKILITFCVTDTFITFDYSILREIH